MPPAVHSCAKRRSVEALCRQHGLGREPRSKKRGAVFSSVVLCSSHVGGRGLLRFYALRSCRQPEASPHSNLVFQLRVHSLSRSGFELDPHYCQLPVDDEVQPDRNSCPAVLTVVWFVLDSNYTRQTSDTYRWSGQPL